MLTQRLHDAIVAVCPIVGVSVGVWGESDSVRIDFRSTASAQQIAAAQAVANTFDWGVAAEQAWQDDQKPERKTLRDAAAQAIADNQAFLSDGTVTQAEAVAQLKSLTRQVNRIIALLAKD